MCTCACEYFLYLEYKDTDLDLSTAKVHCRSEETTPCSCHPCYVKFSWSITLIAVTRPLSFRAKRTQWIDLVGIWLEKSQLLFWKLVESDFVSEKSPKKTRPDLKPTATPRWKWCENHLKIDSYESKWGPVMSISWSGPASNNARWSFCPEAPCASLTPLHQGVKVLLENDGNVLIWYVYYCLLTLIFYSQNCISTLKEVKHTEHTRLQKEFQPPMLAPSMIMPVKITRWKLSRLLRKVQWTESLAHHFIADDKGAWW